MGNGKETRFNGLIEARFGWDAYPKQYSTGLIGGLVRRRTDLDCDGSAIFLGSDGKPLSKKREECCANYFNLSMFGGAARHNGDNQDGGLEDDEVITFDLERIPEEVKTILLTMDLFKEKRPLRSTTIQNTFVRITDAETGEEFGRSDFGGLSSAVRMVTCGVICREEDGWSFHPAGDKYLVHSMEEFLEELWKE